MKKFIGLFVACCLLASPAFARKAEKKSGEFPVQVLALLGDAKFTKLLNDLRTKQLRANKHAAAHERLLPNPYITSYQVRGNNSVGEVTFHLAMNSRQRPGNMISIGMVKAKYKGLQTARLEFVPVKHQRLPASLKTIF